MSRVADLHPQQPHAQCALDILGGSAALLRKGLPGTGTELAVLLAGQEKKLVPGATHTSCTIEMTNMFRRVDVAVVDEVQVRNPGHPSLALAACLQRLRPTCLQAPPAFDLPQRCLLRGI